MKRNRLYTVLGLATAAGYGWVFFSIATGSGHPDSFTPCAIKAVTGIPCPSCGSTRALMLLLNGDFAGSIMMNPIAIILAAIMVLVPLWLAFDLAFGKSGMFEVYKKTENIIRIKWVAIVLTGLVLANWAWNIYKDL